MLKRIFTFLVIGLLVALVGYWIYTEVMRFVDKGQPQQAMPPVVVNVAKAKQEQWYNRINATGSMSAFQGIMLKPEVSGQITKIYFQDGTFIEEGQPVVQIYPDIIEAQLERNKAALKLAQLDYERGVELYKKRVISRQDLDTLTSTLQQSEAAVAQSEAQLVQYNIVAPFSGMLGLRLFDLGSYVSIGDQLVQLQQIDPIRVQFTIPEVYINQLALGQVVDIKPSNLPGKVYHGKVYAIDSGVNPQNRSIGIRARVPNQKRELVPGTFVEVVLNAGEKHPVVTVPQPAIQYSTQGLYVYRIINNKAVKTDVTIGLRKENEVQVTSGIQAGEVIVTAGQIKLTNNNPVEIQPTKNISSEKHGQTQSTSNKQSSNKTGASQPTRGAAEPSSTQQSTNQTQTTSSSTKDE